MIKTLHGRVHGKTIELDEDPGVAEGQEVEAPTVDLLIASVPLVYDLTLVTHNTAHFQKRANRGILESAKLKRP